VNRIAGPASKLPHDGFERPSVAAGERSREPVELPFYVLQYAGWASAAVVAAAAIAVVLRRLLRSGMRT